jgi:hypothetical protein
MKRLLLRSAAVRLRPLGLALLVPVLLVNAVTAQTIDAAAMSGTISSSCTVVNCSAAFVQIQAAVNALSSGGNDGNDVSEESNHRCVHFLHLGFCELSRRVQTKLSRCITGSN